MKLLSSFCGQVLIATTVLIGMIPAPGHAADIPQRKVSVLGTASLKVAPDEMHWTIQVSINDLTQAGAKNRHDASLSSVLHYLKGLGGGLADLQTGGIHFAKRGFIDPNNPAKPFDCSTQVTFTLTSFDKYGPISDTLAKIDGAEVQSVEYATSKAEALQREALKQALLRAHDKANDLAVAAACYIDRPLEITEAGADDSPRPMMRMMNAANGGTPPAVAGQIEISATVTVTYDLFYK